MDAYIRKPRTKNLGITFCNCKIYIAVPEAVYFRFLRKIEEGIAIEYRALFAIITQIVPFHIVMNGNEFGSC
jgi:hypothetical protein